MAIGAPSFDLSAFASSGLSVTFASSDPSVATVSGATVTVVGAGTTTITASQSGNANYLAAAPVSRALIVSVAPPVAVPATPTWALVAMLGLLLAAATPRTARRRLGGRAR